MHAERQIIDKFKFPYTVASKAVPEIYTYWAKKRERSGKPLCRRYWTNTPSSDTNPHHCFRCAIILPYIYLFFYAKY